MNAEIVVTFEATTEMGEQCAHFASFSGLPCRHAFWGWKSGLPSPPKPPPCPAGNPFYARQSYLAQEIAWGGQFLEIIKTPAAGEEAPRYRADLDRCAAAAYPAFLRRWC